MSFRIVYDNSYHQVQNTDPEEVDADEFTDSGDWIDFYKVAGGGRGPATKRQVLRVRANFVVRIEKV